MTRRTRRRQPARVYWVRRLMVLGIATLLVVGIARLLGGSGGGAGPDRAYTAAQTSSPGTTPSSSPTGPATGSTQGPQQTDTSTPTAMTLPSGPCAATDVAVTPTVPKPVAGSPISLVLELSSLSTPACTWQLSGRTLAVKITSGPDLIWTSVQCGKAIPAQDVVLRNTQVTKVDLTWDARRSAPGCPLATTWALPGTYHLSVAALGGQPQEATFVLTAPSPAHVTRTAHPHHGKTQQGH